MNQDIKKFVETLGEVLGDKLPDCHLEPQDTLKDNGIHFHSIVIRKEGSLIAPAIHVDEYFERYNSGSEVLDSIVKDILDQYSEGLKQQKPFEGIDFDILLSAYENVKDRIFMRFLNRDENEELLKKIPYVTYAGDIVIVFKIAMQQDAESVASAYVTNDFLSQWKVDASVVLSDALENANSQGFRFVSLKDMMEEMTGADLSDGLDMEFPMFVLSNCTGINGAVAIAYAAKQIWERLGVNYYVIPSSIHEVLIIPETADITPEYMKEMIESANATAVTKADFLSNELYYYDEEKGIRVA